MRGMLSFLILWLLSKRDMYGQELAKEIGKRKGTKPNPGTIYPALRELKKKGLIELKKEGRITNYRITEKGRKGIETACEYFCRAFGEIFTEHMEVGKSK
jgi:DNA-binding PadR family transcriptional regulator